MKKYIWLNPVVLKMYDQEEVTSHLTNLGFEIITCVENHIDIVKKKYSEQQKGCPGLLCDSRCPKAISYVKDHYDSDHLEYASIYPILIHCAIELAERYKDEEAKVYIITPCTDLRDQGNGLNLKNTVFQTWTQFCLQHRIMPQCKVVENSPIPPGFFDNISNVVSLGSKNDIDCYFKDSCRGSNQLVEMLYCQGGCHNGDGVKVVYEKLD